MIIYIVKDYSSIDSVWFVLEEALFRKGELIASAKIMKDTCDWHIDVLKINKPNGFVGTIGSVTSVTSLRDLQEKFSHE